MREPRPDWSPLGVNFKILDEHPYLFIFESPPPPPGGDTGAWLLSRLCAFSPFLCKVSGLSSWFNICLGIIHLFLNYTLIIYDKFDLIKFIGCIYNIEQLFFSRGGWGWQRVLRSFGHRRRASEA